MSNTESPKINSSSRVLAEKMSMVMCQQTVEEIMGIVSVSLKLKLESFILSKVEDGEVNFEKINFKEIQDVVKQEIKTALAKISES